MITREYALPLTRQCKILSLPRSNLYYQPVKMSEYDLNMMSLIDEIHLRYPFFGSRRISDELLDNGFHASRSRVSNLMKKMGIEALYRKPRLSKPHPGHRIYPYLLRDLKIDRANQAWAIDITYIPLSKGYVYLVAIMDWASRKVLSWRVSNTMESDFCVEALKEAIHNYSCPEIFNTDQGSQFTSDKFTGTLKDNDIQISMDGRGRFQDNIFIEVFKNDYCTNPYSLKDNKEYHDSPLSYLW